MSCRLCNGSALVISNCPACGVSQVDAAISTLREELTTLRADNARLREKLTSCRGELDVTQKHWDVDTLQLAAMTARAEKAETDNAWGEAIEKRRALLDLFAAGANSGQLREELASMSERAKKLETALILTREYIVNEIDMPRYGRRHIDRIGPAIDVALKGCGK